MRVAFSFVVMLTAAVAASGSTPPIGTHVLATGSAPCGVAVGAGSLWVGVYGTGELLRIDPKSGEVVRRFSVGSWACRVALAAGKAGGAAWVTRDRAGVVARLDLRSGRIRRFRVGASPFDVLVATGSVWVTSFEVGTIAEFDLRTTRLARVYKSGLNPAGLTYCGGRIWVGNGRGATSITSIDPASHRIRRVPVGVAGPGWPHCIDRSLWVTATDTLLRLDPRTGRGRGRLRLGGALADAAAGPDGLVWVTDKERSLVHRVNAERLELVDSFPAGPGAFALARTGDAMWVTSFAGADVRRYAP